MTQWKEYIYQCRSFQKQVIAEKKKATMLHSILYACRVSPTESVFPSIKIPSIIPADLRMPEVPYAPLTYS